MPALPEGVDLDIEDDPVPVPASTGEVYDDNGLVLGDRVEAVAVDYRGEDA